MFQIALDFNQPLHNWDTSNVINMESMFSGASGFNQPLNDWNVSSVTKMRSMFKTTNTFNNSLGDWDVSNVTTFVDMFSDANGLSEINKGGREPNGVNKSDVSLVSGISQMSGAGYLTNLMNPKNISSV